MRRMRPRRRSHSCWAAGTRRAVVLPCGALTALTTSPLLSAPVELVGRLTLLGNIWKATMTLCGSAVPLLSMMN